jgi:hypothetical protein
MAVMVHRLIDIRIQSATKQSKIAIFRAPAELNGGKKLAVFDATPLTQFMIKDRPHDYMGSFHRSNIGEFRQLVGLTKQD